MRQIFVASTLAVLGILSACAPAEPTAAVSGPAAVPAPAPMLAGGEWKVTTINGTPVVDNSRATIEFKDGRVFGAASCNRFMGGYTMRSDGMKLEMSQMASTMMACPDALMQQEGQFLKTLGGVTGHSISGNTLTLTGPDGTITATRG